MSRVDIPVFHRLTFDEAAERDLVPVKDWVRYLSAVDEVTVVHERDHRHVCLSFVDPYEYAQWCATQDLDPTRHNLPRYIESGLVARVPVVGNAGATLTARSYMALLSMCLTGEPDTAGTIGFLFDRADHLLDVVSAFVNPSLRATVFTRLTPDDRRCDGCTQMDLHRPSKLALAEPFDVGDRHAFVSALALTCLNSGYLLLESQVPEICPVTDRPFRMLQGWEITNTAFRPLDPNELAGLDWAELGPVSGLGPGPDVILSSPKIGKARQNDPESG